MDQTNLAPDSSDVLRRRSLTDEVYEFLSTKIIGGKYSSGDWLRQEDISTQLGVSQTPVREALDRLVASGLAERVPYRGVRVPIPASKEILDAFMLRLILETLGARLAANVITPEQVHELSVMVEKTANLLTLEDMSTLRQLNKEIHAGIVAIARSNLLSKLYEMTSNAFPDWMLYEYMFHHPELLRTSLLREYQEHRSIIDSLALNNDEVAAYQVALHIKNLGVDLVSCLNLPADSIHEIEELFDKMFPYSKK